jgi:hypothetical protein
MDTTFGSGAGRRPHLPIWADEPESNAAVVARRRNDQKSTAIRLRRPAAEVVRFVLAFAHRAFYANLIFPP